MKQNHIRKLHKAARFMRVTDAGDVDLTNGHWLVRIPGAFWPSDLAKRNAGRTDERFEWDPEYPVPDFDRILPLPLGSEYKHALAPWRTLPGTDHRLLVQNGKEYYLLKPDGFGMDRAYVDALEALGLRVCESADPSNAHILTYYDEVMGLLMPVKV